MIRSPGGPCLHADECEMIEAKTRSSGQRKKRVRGDGRLRPGDGVRSARALNKVPAIVLELTGLSVSSESSLVETDPEPSASPPNGNPPISAAQRGPSMP